MSHAEIIADLKSRGEKNIKFHEDGRITSQHGQSTYNTWLLIGNELKCTDCKTNYSP